MSCFQCSQRKESAGTSTLRRGCMRHQRRVCGGKGF
ncbi:hypothetical protein CLOLEP_02392 [[Clostridium] leptum DSM 753]|uniref:Uncharacterized protein n=1 Tax=[Clostridium] leptum DSM 753 TaxID=428125 RepID=A7VUZ0_9FIRM|nr:hypothetical protein CLOLEP_02392 [[Clostridium] leptum DSM 753]